LTPCKSAHRSSPGVYPPSSLFATCSQIGRTLARLASPSCANSGVALLVATLALGLVGCGSSNGAEPSSPQRYSKKKLQTSLASVETAGLVLGEFDLQANGVVDGDTIKVVGLPSTLRLLALDSEETFKNEQYRRLAETDFEAYMKMLRGTRLRPPKAMTPMGEEAKKWAKRFFDGIRRVRLERDHPKEIKGRYNRYLVYVFVEKNGKWVNYNVEHVRAGMSPYFTKYAYSRRFHDEFVQAEKEAREARRGIWSPDCKCNKDYPERLEWWNARADFIREFENKAAERDDYVILTHWDSTTQLEKLVDREVTVLGLVGGVREPNGRGPYRVILSRKMFNDMSVIMWDKEVFEASGVTSHKGEFIAVTGLVQYYENKYRKRREIQLVIETPSAIVRSRVPGIPLGTKNAALGTK
jgi:endonuclease YncB( thermonuclease family)